MLVFVIYRVKNSSIQTNYGVLTSKSSHKKKTKYWTCPVFTVTVLFGSDNIQRGVRMSFLAFQWIFEVWFFFFFAHSKPDIGGALVEHAEDTAGGPPGLELLQHLQGDATTIVEKERKLSEMILQLQLFREQLLTHQDHSNKVSPILVLFYWVR